jgi:hypothetical protein
MTGKKIVTVPARREAVQNLVAHGLSQRPAWVLPSLQRSTVGNSTRPAGHADLAAQVDELARRYPRYGSRRV